LGTLQILGIVIAIASVALLATSFARRKPIARFDRGFPTAGERDESEMEDIRVGAARKGRAGEGFFLEMLQVDLLSRVERIERDITWLIRGMGILFAFVAAIAFKA
jgi:hypothetical protein